ncbi:hypothetical protein DOK67_0000629 [Enterococcus sp. DIV0212c]|uniref:FAD-dependent oxidoreductase n=1 Tax=Enterococcus sp. DIV0212c TaxID=2230867 RepID=UPI001A9AED6F|nr:FAD-dependent oxidoreductase [Enterococcus sp. DIV0212c]MBO1354546.1 NAD-binding protein [Enterococcus sp. DIV0212c]
MSFTGYKDCHLYQLPVVKREVTEKQLAQRILVIDSGVSECMLAIDLAKQGKEVTIIERSDEILSDCLAAPKRAELMRQLENLVVTIFLETFCIDVEANHVCLSNQEGFKTVINIDNIIVSKKL